MARDKDARLNIRISTEDLKLLKEAAQQAKMSLSTFMILGSKRFGELVLEQSRVHQKPVDSPKTPPLADDRVANGSAARTVKRRTEVEEASAQGLSFWSLSTSERRAWRRANGYPT